MSKVLREGIIDPEKLYTVEALAREFGCTARRLRDDYVNTGQWPSVRVTRSTRLIPGWVIRAWAQRDLEGESPCE